MAFPLSLVSSALAAECPSPRSASAYLSRLRQVVRALGRFSYADEVEAADALLVFERPAEAAAWIERGVLREPGILFGLAGPREVRDPRHGMKSDASKRGYFSTLLKVLSLRPVAAELARRSAVRGANGGVSAEAIEAARALFAERLGALTDSWRAAADSSEVSERESRSILPWSELVSAHAAKRGELGAEDRLVADLYLLCPDENPPKRLDYGEVRLLRGDKTCAGAEGAEGRSDGNTLRLCDGVLTLREYKTSCHYGVFVQRLPERLLAEVRAFVADCAGRGAERRYLLEAGGGGPLSPSALGARVSAVMRRLSGVAVGASNLRKAYLTQLMNTPNLSLRRQKEAARLMMHGFGAQQQGYRRVNLRPAAGDC